MESTAELRPTPFAAWRKGLAAGPEAVAAAWQRRVAAARAEAGWEAAIVGLFSRGEGVAAGSSGADGPLAGVPFMVKDLFDVAGEPTTASSLFLAQERPRPTRSAAMVRALCAHGAVPQGKTHLNEFAYGLDGINAHFGAVPNPRDPSRLAGGSSSGSAWAVGCGLVPLAIGTDTGGSIRVPAAYGGLYGFRLTPEHPWSRDGCFPLAPRFDTAGWFTAFREDMEAVLALLTKDEVGMRTDLSPGLDLTGAAGSLEPGLAQAVAAATTGWTRSANPVEESAWRSETAPLLEAFHILQSTEAAGLHRAWLHPRRAEYDPATWQRIARGEQWSASQHAAADRLARAWEASLAAWIGRHGFLVLPTVPDRAPLLTRGMSPTEREAILALTVPASLAGHPVLSLPLALDAEGGAWTALQVILPRRLEEALPLARALLARGASAAERMGPR